MKKLISLLLSAAVLLLCGFFFLYYLDKSASGIRYKEGDAFTGMKVSDMGGSEKDISELSHTKKLIVFVWEKCSDCRAGYDNYRSLVSLYDNQGIDIIFIWRNNIPGGLSKSPLGSIKHYSTKNISVYTKYVPAYYLVDENNKISKITEDFQRVEEYLSGGFKPNARAVKEWVGTRIVFFTLNGCSACMRAYQEAAGKLDMSKVYVVGNGEAMEEGNNDLADVHDRYSIYAHAMNVRLFPAFALLHDNEIAIVDSVDKLLHLDISTMKGSTLP